MQSDKELLMLAANAAGFAYGEWTKRGIVFAARDEIWNSLCADGDCARLEAACDLDVKWGKDFVRACRELIVEPFWVNAIERFSDHGGDKNKARRYASTRAAASLAQAAQGEMG